MKKLGKILSFVMAIVLAIGTLTVTALADEPDYVFLGDCTVPHHITVDKMSYEDAEDIVIGITEDNPGIGESYFIYDYDEYMQMYECIEFSSYGLSGSSSLYNLFNLWVAGKYKSAYLSGSIGAEITKPSGCKFEIIDNIDDLSNFYENNAQIDEAGAAALAFDIDAYYYFTTSEDNGNGGIWYNGYNEYGDEIVCYDNSLIGSIYQDEPVAILVEADEPETTTAEETTTATETTTEVTTTTTTASTGVKTGDSSNMTIYVIALIALVAAAGVTIFSTKKSK